MSDELKRITYVEDEPDIRAVAELALTQIGGFELDVCVDGFDALRRTPDFRPDLILLDVMMPGMDGTETLAKLREIPELADVPVVFMTAKAQRHEIAAFLKLGVLSVIPKPFDPMTLSSELRDIWNMRILKDQGAPDHAERTA
ncbi:CheY-like chemotaxis protein [Rhodobium orientis]|uniref:Response regulatory domain-containing protein n=1 Tax=Rhodobium orientis TaxID=34017 RepID=A0A327JPM3_9HYPH|nr:response regulator [Rhodobium orientis]MBB4301295.1 CheY-like chemotaxis protein [Rhodobium orientis]MBK5951116.1 hypothetical protein [Rhodobium orientis]RAI26822.1 hypothetical protein CH339_12340 [Rhodobium orientis]